MTQPIAKLPTGVAGCRVLVVGLGVSGRAAVSLLQRAGAKVDGYDDREAVGALPEVGDYQCVVVSPGLPQSHPVYKAALVSGVPVIGEAELAMRCLNGRKAVGITGTNGKTTVTLLTEHLLQKAGYPAVAMGNVGKPFSEVTGTSSDAVVVGEFSSYQLETLKTRCLDAAVILNITPDHLDRYDGFEQYAHAKLRIARCLCEGGVLYLHESVAVRYRKDPVLQGTMIKTIGCSASCDVAAVDGMICIDGVRVGSLPEALGGASDNDITNYLAAYMLASTIAGAGEQLRDVAGFAKPAHRLQCVGAIDGVDYYDDSKGTNLEAVIHAVHSIKQPIVLLAGGKHKGASYTPWKVPFKGRVTHLVAYGEAAQAISDDLRGDVPITVVNTLEEAVEQARKSATPGDAILLSPGCSSFDQYENYIARGEHFQRIINAI